MQPPVERARQSLQRLGVRRLWHRFRVPESRHLFICPACPAAGCSDLESRFQIYWFYLVGFLGGLYVSRKNFALTGFDLL
jgi:hypothetical protein